MKQIDNYPYTFKLSGEDYEVNKNMMRKIDSTGKEDKVVFTGDVLHACYSEEIDEYVLILKHHNGYHAVTKKHGWLGPFSDVSDVEFDSEGSVAVLHGKKEGKEGPFKLER
jgi:hypothetical protein